MQAMKALKMGDRGPEVKEMQQMLIGLGISVGDRTGADGVFGQATRDGVVTFQRMNGLAVTGMWGLADAERAQALAKSRQPAEQIGSGTTVRQAELQELHTLAQRMAALTQAMLEC